MLIDTDTIPRRDSASADSVNQASLKQVRNFHRPELNSRRSKVPPGARGSFDKLEAMLEKAGA
jgi:hypothetical protein